MKLVALLWLQLCFVSSVLSAAGDLGDACLSTDPKCTPRGSYCVSATSKCACGSNFVQSGTKCVPIYAQPCGAGMCPPNNICGTDGNCQACPTGSTNVNGKCLKVIGQTCTATTDCITSSGVICGTRDSATKCTCDTNNKFGKGTDGDSRCSCDTGYSLRGDGTCGKTILTCTADTNCQAGAKCDTTTHLCVCDSTKGLVASAGSCVCDTNRALKADGRCGLVIGPACNASTPCIDGATCDTTTTNKCMCDSANHLVASGTTACVCDTNYAMKADGSCGLVVGQTCTANTQCIDGAKCGASGSGSCICDTALNFATSGTTGCGCATNYAKKTDGTCGKVIEQGCTAGQCINGAVCDSTSNKCTCDIAKKFSAGVTGAASCACTTDYALRDFTTGCGIKVAGTSCSTASDCADNMLCTSGFCTCDATKNFAMTAAGVCGCKTNFARKGDNTCGKVLDQSCTSDAECIDNAICKDVNGAKSCKCDDTKNYTAPAIGTSECVCATNYGLRLDGTCGKKVGQDCTKASDCMKGAACDLETKKCVCDAANGYQLASGSTTSCGCMTGYTANRIGCAKDTGATCSSTCSSYASCNATYGFCQCDAGAALNSDTYTCSTGSKAVMASVVLLLMVLVTSRLN